MKNKIIKNETIWLCQKCGKKILKSDIKTILIEEGQQKGLVLQVGLCCYNRIPSFREKAIYKND